MIINAYEIFGNIIFLFKQMKRIDLTNAMVLYAIGRCQSCEYQFHFCF